MSWHAPISLHLDLYRYWDAKRALRSMPARRDLDPAEMRGLLPYLTIVEEVDGEFRYRLVGTAVSRERGIDLTGQPVGSSVNPPEYAAALVAGYRELFDAGRPCVTTAVYQTPSGIMHNTSRMLLPLSENDRQVNMVIFTRITRLNRQIVIETDWLRRAAGKVRAVVEIASFEELEAHCQEWERQSLATE
jgi:hypothetical protein